MTAFVRERGTEEGGRRDAAPLVASLAILSGTYADWRSLHQSDI